eukprot:PLAT6129.1.p1 GENE.PLAT6129.1~~PLAT6129.1.p1  ORF type:complete len:453 (-),score=167.07 PLAT6129.1:66-1424(-)
MACKPAPSGLEDLFYGTEKADGADSSAESAELARLLGEKDGDSDSLAHSHQPAAVPRVLDDAHDAVKLAYDGKPPGGAECGKDDVLDSDRALQLQLAFWEAERSDADVDDAALFHLTTTPDPPHGAVDGSAVAAGSPGKRLHARRSYDVAGRASVDAGHISDGSCGSNGSVGSLGGRPPGLQHHGGEHGLVGDGRPLVGRAVASPSPPPSAAAPSSEAVLPAAAAADAAAHAVAARSKLVPQLPARGKSAEDSAAAAAAAAAAATVAAAASTTGGRRGRRVYRCSYPGCGAEYRWSKELTLHTRRVHTHERPFACSHEGCGKRFIDKKNLKAHLRTHTSERPYVCTQDGCLKSFRQRSGLQYHLHAAHGKEGRYACLHPGCGRKFYAPYMLRKHMAKHEAETAKVDAAVSAEKERILLQQEVVRLRGLLEEQEKRLRDLEAENRSLRAAPSL